MPGVVLSHASPVEDLLDPSQNPNIEIPASSVMMASNSNTASHTQDTTLQPQGPSSYAARQFTNSVDGSTPIPFEMNRPIVAATSVSELTHADPTGNLLPEKISPLNVDIPTGISVGISESVQRPPITPKVLSTTLQPSSTANIVNDPTSKIETVPTQGLSTKSPSPGIDTHISLTSGTRASTADYKSQYISPSSQTLIVDPTVTRGSVSSASAQNLPISSTQVLPDFGFTSSFLSRPVTTPTISNQSSPFTTSVQSVTANSLSPYSIVNQTLTPGGVITVSGTKISLTPNGSDRILGTGTQALSPSVSAHLGPGPNGTEVQKFTGHATGATDGLWSSSLMLLASFLLMLWI